MPLYPLGRVLSKTFLEILQNVVNTATDLPSLQKRMKAILTSTQQIYRPNIGGPVIGVPRALLYFEYFAFWSAFLSALGASLAVSPETNRMILDSGVKVCVDESCLPVKVFHGHVEFLKQKAEWLLVPRIVSVVPREYTCPKLLGLPDMVREQLAPGQRMIDVTLDLTKKGKGLLEACLGVGRLLGMRAPEVYRALFMGCVRQAMDHRLRRLEGARTLRQRSKAPTVGLIGHRYLLQDNGLNLGLLRNLRNCGIDRVLTDDCLSDRCIASGARCLRKPLFWTFEKRVAGAGLHLLKRRVVDGVIQLVSFGCGPDSMVSGLIQSEARALGVPYMLLTVDEHTGEVGAQTRVEAFVDMLRWKAQRA